MRYLPNCTLQPSKQGLKALMALMAHTSPRTLHAQYALYAHTLATPRALLAHFMFLGSRVSQLTGCQASATTSEPHDSPDVKA
jgi:hypothetical protein